MPVVRLLHVSDLHQRGPREATDRWKRRRVLGDAWVRNLEELVEAGSIDLLCFTGDLADWGLGEEYGAATEFLDQLCTYTQVPRARLFLVPGNHDIQRLVEEDAWRALRECAAHNQAGVATWLAGQRAPYGAQAVWRDAVLERGTAFWRYCQDSLGLAHLNPTKGWHGRLGYHHELTLEGQPFPVHIVGLDSAWLCGDDADAGKILLTEEQVGSHVHDASGQALPGLRIALVHHPLAELADGPACRRLLADRVDLLLCGHVHETDVCALVEPGRELRQLAAGCLYEGSHAHRWPNSCQLIEIETDANGRPLCYTVRFRSWSPRGHWHDDSSLYAGAPSGILRWSVDDSQLRVEPVDRARPSAAIVGRTWKAELADFLMARFDTAFLRIWVQLHLSQITHDLPGEKASIREHAWAVVDRGHQHGVIDHAFFQELEQARPQLAVEIADLKQKWQRAHPGRVHPGRPEPVPDTPTAKSKPRPVIPARSSTRDSGDTLVAPTPTAVELDRLAAWGEILDACRDDRRHLAFVVHGTHGQYLRAFIQRITQYLHHEAPHLVRQVHRFDGRSRAQTAEDWKRQFIAATSARGTRRPPSKLEPLLFRETSVLPPLWIFTQHGGPLQQLDDASVEGLGTFLYSNLSGALGNVQGKLAHPIRIVVPVSHPDQGCPPEVGRLAAYLKKAANFEFSDPLEITFPPLDEVRDFLDQRYPTLAEKVWPACEALYNRVTANPDPALQDLATPLHELIFSELDRELL